MTQRKAAGLVATGIYVVSAVGLAVMLVNTPYITPKNAGATWSVFELAKVGLEMVGIWLAGWAVGGAARRGE